MSKVGSIIRKIGRGRSAAAYLLFATQMYKGWRQSNAASPSYADLKRRTRQHNKGSCRCRIRWLISIYQRNTMFVSAVGGVLVQNRQQVPRPYCCSVYRIKDCMYFVLYSASPCSTLSYSILPRVCFILCGVKFLVFFLFETSKLSAPGVMEAEQELVSCICSLQQNIRPANETERL